MRASPGEPEEARFAAWSCWMADCLPLQGRHAEARAPFERALAVCNDAGLVSEEYNLPARQLAGNLPQALTHLSLVYTALGLSGPGLHRAAG